MPAEPPRATYTLTNAFGSLSFSRPVAIVSAPGNTNRLFIVEQGGRISVITNLAAPNSTVFLDITDRVQYDGSEEGLLSLVFHPGYATNRYFYVWYTTRSTLHDRLSRFEIDPANSSRALPNTEQILINQQDEAPNHNGGQLLFGADGYLYLSIGDEGHSAFLNNVQRIDRDFFSCILRIDVDKRLGNISPNPHPANGNGSGGFNYAIPADNPFIGTTNFNNTRVDPAKVRTEFWAVGLRNSWRMAFDPATGLLYCADVGQTDREEINIIARGGNYGWPYMEGYLPYTGLGNPPQGFNPTAPIMEYRHGSGTNEGNSITGGFVYRGARHPELYGAYVFGDYVSGNIWSLRYQPGQTNPVPFTRIAVGQYISAFGEDPSNGDILLTDYAGNQIKRLVRSSSSGAPLPPTLADTGAFSSLANLTPQPGIVPYDLNVPFWSDYAQKTRWFSVPNPNLTVSFNSSGNWSFPTGTVWIKHFDLELTNGVPASAKRLETRLLVRSQDGVYGVTYRWGNSLNNATLVPDEGLDESFVIRDGGNIRTQVWHYPGRSECLRCHTPQGGYALGFNTPQLNRNMDYSGTTENQVAAFSRVGYLNVSVTNPQTLPALSRATNSAFSIEHRSRSYLSANCAQCHQPGGAAQGLWDARFSTPLDQANIVNGALLNDFGNPLNKVWSANSLAHSMLFRRVAEPGTAHMPPLATSELNQEAISLLRTWILSPTRPLPPTNLRTRPN